MFKLLCILALGIAIGYSYGWKDAHLHEQHIAERLIGRVGGDNKEKFSGDIDTQMSKAGPP